MAGVKYVRGHQAPTQDSRWARRAIMIALLALFIMNARFLVAQFRIQTHVSRTATKSLRPLEPLALATLPATSEDITLSHLVFEKFTATFPHGKEMDIMHMDETTPIGDRTLTLDFSLTNNGPFPISVSSVSILPTNLFFAGANRYYTDDAKPLVAASGSTDLQFNLVAQLIAGLSYPRLHMLGSGAHVDLVVEYTTEDPNTQVTSSLTHTVTLDLNNVINLAFRGDLMIPEEMEARPVLGALGPGRTCMLGANLPSGLVGTGKLVKPTYTGGSNGKEATSTEQYEAETILPGLGLTVRNLFGTASTSSQDKEKKLSSDMLEDLEKKVLAKSESSDSASAGDLTVLSVFVSSDVLENDSEIKTAKRIWDLAKEQNLPVVFGIPTSTDSLQKAAKKFFSDGSTAMKFAEKMGMSRREATQKFVFALPSPCSGNSDAKLTADEVTIAQHNWQVILGQIPGYTQAMRHNHMDSFKSVFERSWRNIIAFMMACSMLFTLVAYPLVDTFFDNYSARYGKYM